MWLLVLLDFVLGPLFDGFCLLLTCFNFTIDRDAFDMSVIIVEGNYSCFLGKGVFEG